jgi:branched-chain amino acid aminotransferase
MSDSRRIWVNGRLVPHVDATVHVGSTALHFGPVAFEGIRCHARSDGGANLFRLTEHLDRLVASARALHLEVPFTTTELAEACRETVLANGHVDAYLRPLVFPGESALGFGRPGGPAETCIQSFPWDNRHLERSQKKGIAVHVSSVIRTEAHPVMSKSKISANYAAGLLAIHEARQAGYDEAILLDGAGAVAEASTANVFAVFGDRLVTPPLGLPILAGITRDAVMVLAAELGIPPSEETFDVHQLASADEVFLTSTTSELTPVRDVDGTAVRGGPPGPVTSRLLSALHAAVRGEGEDRGWSHSLHRAEARR